MIYGIITYFAVGLTLCIWLRCSGPPTSWQAYPMIIFGWPVVVWLVMADKI